MTRSRLADAIVEVPATVDKDGLRPATLPPLPDAIAALCGQQVAIQKLCVAAAATGDRETALQALLLDPVIAGAERVEEMLGELMEANDSVL